MAKTDIYGFGGSVTLPASTIGGDVTSWSATVEIATHEIPPAFGGKWTKTVLGAGKVTGSLRGNLVYNAAGTQPCDLSGTDWTKFAGSLTCTATTGCSISGAVVFHNFQIGEVTNGQPATFSVQFANSGDDFAVTWDVT